MSSKVSYIPILVLLASLTLGVFPQQSPQVPYSQSTIYEPRQFGEVKSKDKPNEIPAVPPVTDQGPVTIPVSLLNANQKPVTGLGENNFSVYVEGRPVKVTIVEKQTSPLRVLFLIDSSAGSKTSYRTRQRVASSILAHLEPGELASIVTFGRQATVRSELTADRKKVQYAIDDLKPRDGRSLYDAIRFVFEKHLLGGNGPVVVFLVSDGLDGTSSHATFSSSLEWAERSGAIIVPVYLDTLEENLRDPGRDASHWVAGGISGSLASEILEKSQKRNERLKAAYEFGTLYLSDLTFISGGRAVAAERFNTSPAETATELLAAIRESYSVTFKPVSSGTVGTRQRLLVRVNLPGLSVMAPGSYIVR